MKQLTTLRYLKVVLPLLLALFCSVNGLAQCTSLINFESSTSSVHASSSDPTPTATSFTHIGKTFNITSQTSGQVFFVDGTYPSDGYGWNGSANDNIYISNNGYASAGTGLQFTIGTSDASLFALKSFWLQITDATVTNPVSATVTITGKIGSTTVFTVTKSTGWVSSFGTNNGFNLIDLSTLAGVNNSNTLIDKFTITTSSAAPYMQLDALTLSNKYPTTTTSAATSVTSTSATLNGTINANSFATTSNIFQYSTSSTLSSGVVSVTATPSTVSGSSATAVSASISSLTSGTTYYYRVGSTNCGGTSYGSIMSFVASGSNTTPTFVSSSPQTLTVCQDASATDIKSLMHVSDVDASQTLTWTESTAPGHGTLNLTGATASSGSSNITPGGTMTYTPAAGYSGSDMFVVQVSDGTASSVMTVNVTVNPAPNPGTVTGNAFGCVTAFISHSASGGTAGGVWSSSNTAVGTINASNGTFADLTAGTTIVSYTVTNSCGTASDTMLTTVYALSDPGSISGPSSVCAGSTITMTNSTTTTGFPYTYAWSSSATAIATVNATTGVVTGLSAGTSRISYTITGCGLFRTFFTVNVLPASVNPTITGTTTVLTGSTTTLGNATAGGTWSSSNIAVGSIGSSSGVVTGIVPGTTTISYVIANACGTFTATVNVTVNATFDGTQSQTNVTCNGGADGTATVTVSGGVPPYIYSWAPSGGTDSTATGLSAGTYSVTVTDAVSASFTKVFTITEPGPVMVSGTGTVCPTNTLTLTPSTTGGTWSSSNTAIATVGSSTGVVTGVAGGTATITYTTSCGDVTTEVTVNPAPNPGTVTGNTFGCVTAFISHSASGGTAGGVWSSSNTAVGTINASNGTFADLAAGTTIVSYTVINSCGTASDTMLTTVYALSDPGSISGPSSVCAGSTITMTNSTTTTGFPYTYAWSSSATAIATVNATTGVVTGLSTGTTRISYTIAGCGLFRTFFTVNVLTTPTVAAITGTTTVVQGTSSALGDVTSGGVWSSTNTAAGTVDASGNVTGISPGNTTISYLVTNSCGTTAATVDVTVVSSLSITQSQTNVTCFGGNDGTATVTPSGGVLPLTYSWAPSGGSAATATGLTAGTYTVTVTDASSYSVAATFTITQPAAFTITSVDNNGPACVGATLSLSTVSSGGSTPISYAWSGPNAFSSTAQNPSITGVTMVASGIYSVTLTDNTGCVATGTNTTSATINNLPTIGGISATPGTLCEGATLTLTATGATGTGSITSYNWSGPSSYSSTTTTATQTYTVPASGSGLYSVSVTYPGTGCTSTQVSSSPVIVEPQPTVYAVSGGGGYCAGDIGLHIVLNFSETGINYQLYNGASAVGSPAAGSNSALDFGLQTTAGTYTVMATNASTACARAMSGSASISINPLPTAYAVSGGGAYCAGGTGVSIGVGNSDAGINYQLYKGATAIGTAVPGTGTAISFGSFTTAGTYSVLAADATTGCTKAMTGTATISVNALPTAYTVTGGGAYCSGSGGVHVGLSNSDPGVNYQLYNGSTTIGSVVAGASSALDFGLQTGAGVYTVMATTVSSGCQNGMSGNAIVVVNPLPTAFTVGGGGTICAGAAGVSVTLSNSNTGISYQLYNGSTAVGSAVSGTGFSISFGAQTVAGTYTVLATNNTTSCTNAMTSSATVVVNPLPTAYTMTGGGSYCAGGAGFALGLSNSQTGINYQLYNGAATVGSAVGGTTGSTISFGTQTTAGTYTVLATDASTTCTNAMSSSATIVINPLPTIYTVTGGGAYCAGGAGASIGLSNSETGVNYQLYDGASTSGSTVAGTTGSAITFGTRTNASTYSVVATNGTTGCVNNMSGTVSVSINPLPAVQTVTGGGAFCAGGAGVAVGLSGSVSGINYQLYNGASTVGSTMAGTGSSLDYGNQTTGGTYSVLATDATTGCTNAMTGTATVVVNALPTSYSVTGGGSYCAGGSGFSIGLVSSNTGINYQLYNGAATVGSPVGGNNSAISFGVQTAAGTYTVLATNATTSCTNSMTGSSSIIINPLPTPQTVTGGGAYCVGSAAPHIGLNFSASGVDYQLYNGASTVGSAIAGASSSLDFGVQSVSGTYTVLGTNTTTGCTNAMSGNAVVIVNPLPVAYTVTGGGHYCSGTGGLPVGLSNSETSVNYQLYNGTTATGSPVAGTTGSPVTFGSQTASGTYTVRATNSTTSCVSNMTGSVSITIDPLPTVYTMTGGGAYCSGGAGLAVGLSGSNTGINYQLYNGVSTVGSPVAGTGSNFSFGTFTASGTYSVIATNTVTACVNNMSGTSTIVINPLPAVFSMAGGGSYCAGGSGVAITLGGSASGINYQLYRGSTLVGSPVAGTGAAISFGQQTAAGTYSVLATNTSTSCTKAMSGSATVIINSLPAVYNVTGGGAYCAGGAGVAVGLSSSETGVAYQLYNGTSVSGTPIFGTGGAISYGMLVTAGTYTVRATNTTSCVSNMTGSATISINPVPTVFNMSGGGTFCAGGSGLAVGLSGSTSGITYQLYRGTTLVSTQGGTGSAISFGLQTVAGTYTVLATNPTTGCLSNMSGSSVVIVNAQPALFDVTGGGAYCAGGTGVNVGLSGSASGINYQLYNGATPLGTAVAGSGATLNFGLQTVVGTYTVLATNTTTGCTRAMNGNASIATNPLPTAFNVTGGGGFCAGTAGVAVGLGGSATGINYQLYMGAIPVGSPVTGTNSAINFGLQSMTGSYSVRATNTTTGCINNMTGSVSVFTNPLPNMFTVSSGGSYCSGGTGVAINMGGTETGVNYQLYLGSSVSGTPVAGTGSSVTFGLRTAAGTYTVLASNATTGCANTMSGSAIISINPLPTVYNVTGGGGYCNGGAGAVIGLSGSNAGITYSLFNGATLAATVIGSGGAVSFAPQTTAATYTVLATNTSTSCTSSMAGNATIFVNALPATYSVTGGGNYCAGGAGVHIGLSNSASGVNYQLYRGSAAVGSAIAGTGTGIDFGLFANTGTYTVSATAASTGCSVAMLGSATVGLNSLPLTFNVVGGGTFCAGGTGVTVGLDNSETGVSYQLFNGTSTSGFAVAGTGSAINFGNQPAGTYTVMATNATTTCSSDMSGSISVIANPLPVQYNVSGGGSYCAGGTGFHIALSGSDFGINYQLYNGATAVGSSRPGTGGSIDFGVVSSTGIYTVRATNPASSCTNAMTGSASITVNALPTVFNVTGGGNYCVGGSGLHVGLSGSANGINYQLYNGSTALGSVLSGTGSPLDFGVMSAAGTYSVRATNSSTTCAANMAGNAMIAVNPLPQVYPITSGGSICAGSPGIVIYVTGSETGVNYQLYSGATPVGSPVPGNTSFVGFGLMTTPGTYSVVATNPSTSCSSNMTGSATISVNPSPSVFSVTGGGSYCSSGNGVAVGLNGSETGVNYQLYNGSSPVGTIVAGNGGSISFGLNMAAGTYTVAAANAISSCTTNMAGFATVVVNSAPNVYSVSGGGNYCAGTSGIEITLTNSDMGVSYQLYNGSSVSGSAVAGTGGDISFGLKTTAGTYTVLATNTTSGCSSNMLDNAIIGVNPVPTIYTVTGGGSYCNGGAGVSIGLAGSATGITYQLYNGASASGVAVAGTGGPISFGLKTAAGSYTVLATDASTSCTRNMSGNAAVTVNSLPILHSVTGGGSYCAGGSGMFVSLDGSDAGVTYQLYNGSTPVFSPVGGSGEAIDFGSFTVAGTYSVVAVNSTTGCSRPMTGTAAISVNALPSAFVMSSGGNYCSGTPGVTVSLSGSTVGINYQLYRGSASIGMAVPGTGNPIIFGLQTTGTYTVRATNPLTGCTNNMTGSSVVTLRSAPAVYTVSGGGSYCAGGAGYSITLNWSDMGVNYQLYNGSTPVGIARAGINGMLDFGVQMTAGTYSVMAINATYGCTAGMAGGATITVNSAPPVHTVTGGGGICAGGAGIAVGLNASDFGVNYVLYVGSDMASSPVAGNGGVIDFGPQTTAGTYTVAATDVATGCISNMTGNAVVAINSNPATHNIVASASSYCAGGSGVNIILDGSNTGISYQLYNNGTASGTAIAGTGAPINFGLKTAAGVYSVLATNTLTSCSSSMTGNPTITINPLPAVYNVTGGGAYCEDANGMHIGLSGSNSGISYQLYNSTGGAMGLPVAGTGDILDFGLQTVPATYTIIARDNTTSCTRSMTGSASISINPLPAAFNVTGGGGYCSGNTGVHVGLGGSTTGVNYQLYRGATAIGSAVSGGSTIDFGVYTVAGVYTVMATDQSTTCSRPMTGNATVSVNALPAIYNVSGGGNYCPGGSGVAVGMATTDAGVRYQLYRGSAMVGSSVTGTGGTISFGVQSATGTYSVLATNIATGCARAMSGAPAIGLNTLPVAYTVSSGGSYCAGGTGVDITMPVSQSGVNYQLYQGATSVGSPVAGTGGIISLGLQTAAGVYTVMATDAATMCTNNMLGSAMVSITPTVAATVSVASTASGTVCAGTHVTFSATAVNGGSSPVYQWKVNGVNVGFPVSSYTYAPANGDIVSVTFASSETCAMPAMTSASVTATVQANQTPAVAITADPGTTVCNGTTVTFTPTPAFGGSAPTYSWWKNGINVATGMTYTVTPNNNDVIYCEMTSNYACRLATVVSSDSVTMTVNQPLVPIVAIIANPGTTIAAGQEVEFTAFVNNAGPTPQYQWLVNGNIMAGATTATFTTSDLADNDSVTCVVLSSGPCGSLPSYNTVIMKVNSNVAVTQVNAANIDVKIIPNPNKGIFTVKGALGIKDNQPVILEMTDMLGQIVYSSKAQVVNGNIDQRIELDNTLANGMYLLNIKAATNNKVFYVTVSH